MEFSGDDRLGPRFAAALSTGLRQGELFALGWEDIDFE
jgi:integrase